MRSLLPGGTSAIAAAVALLASPAHAQMNCSALANLSIPNGSVTAAASVSTGDAVPSGLGGTVTAPVDFCRVQLTLTPVDGSNIQMEVWLPTPDAWDGRFEGTGNGGFNGAIYTPNLAAAVARGDATANSDQGHIGGVADASFIVGHPQSFVDFGYRATHLMTVTGKLVTQAYYGKPQDYAYFTGCSSGGRQALKEAQMYPDDYNGILAGDPANNWVNLNVDQIYEVQVNEANPAGTISPEDFTLINQAVLAQCGALDGVQDPGFVANPALCHFDPSVLQCASGQTTDCLTEQQVQTVRAVYQGPTDGRTGQSLFPGFEPGSETLWGAITPTGTPGGFAIADSYFQYFVFGDPNWDYLTLNYTTDLTAAEQQDHGVVGAQNANLARFAGNGGKLIQYHGWADTTIASGSSTNYYTRVAMGRAGNTPQQRINAIATPVSQGQLDNLYKYYRLFMVPGMAHCFGGPGPNAFGQPFAQAVPVGDAQHDIITALEQWVEKGVAPEQIVATKYVNDTPSQGVAFSRPLCPYPMTAHYSGSGDQTNAASFTCVPGPQQPN
ncbi:MAG TPA: tannase/feruloyl esterase family alpha/beta hydrolase [Rhodopila sp.]